MTPTKTMSFEKNFSLFRENEVLWSIEAFTKRMDNRIAKIRALKEISESSPLVNSAQNTHE